MASNVTKPGAQSEVEASSINLQKAVASADLDPRLQRLIERCHRGFEPLPTASTQTGQVAVIARVKDVPAWVALPEVKPGAVLGTTPDEEGTIVTARVPLKRLEYLHGLPNVLSIKAAQRVKPCLRETLRDIGARKDLLPPSLKGRQGRGTVVGVVDFGCDFTHADFRNADGTTRLIGIWDQNGPSSPTSPFRYGRFYSREELNKALKSANPFKTLGYRPDRARDWSSGSHGTHVLGIAGGNGRGSQQPGVAPEADLLFVELAASDIPWQGEEVTRSSFGDSVQLLEAVQFIFDTAGDKPCVVNLSLGTNGGPHDGSTLVERGIDATMMAAPNRAVVIAASNSHADGIHLRGSVPADRPFDLTWEVQNGDRTDNELEVWYGEADELTLELLTPGGKSLGRVPLGSNARLLDKDGNLGLFVSHRRKDPNNGDNVLGILLAAGMPVGRWTVRLHPVRITQGHFHAWIERDDAGQSSFVQPDSAYTLGSISCGKKSIVVGSYDATKAGVPLSYFSSEGPTRDGREKPEVSAPGQDVWAPRSGSSTGITEMSGTSMAAPAVSGAVALILAEANARGIPLPIDELRGLLLQGARAMGDAWHPRYGQGRISVPATLQALLALPVPAPGTAALVSSDSPPPKKPLKGRTKGSRRKKHHAA